jgi:transposase
VPELYRLRTTLYNCFVRWRAVGVWDRLLAAVSAAYDGDIVMIESSCARVRQHGAAVKRGIPMPEMVTWDAPGAS